MIEPIGTVAIGAITGIVGTSSFAVLWYEGTLQLARCQGFLVGLLVGL